MMMQKFKRAGKDSALVSIMDALLKRRALLERDISENRVVSEREARELCHDFRLFITMVLFECLQNSSKALDFFKDMHGETPDVFAKKVEAETLEKLLFESTNNQWDAVKWRLLAEKTEEFCDEVAELVDD